MQDKNSRCEKHRQVGILMLISFGIVGCATACGLLAKPPVRQVERPPKPTQAVYANRDHAVSRLLLKLDQQTGVAAPPSR